MARAKQNARVELPKGFKPIKGLASSWDYEETPVLVGRLKEFHSVESQYKDDSGKKKMQRNAVIEREGDSRLITVWESAGTRPLFDVKIGAHVAIMFEGRKKIKGRKQPMKMFTVAVRS